MVLLIVTMYRIITLITSLLIMLYFFVVHPVVKLLIVTMYRIITLITFYCPSSHGAADRGSEH